VHHKMDARNSLLLPDRDDARQQGLTVPQDTDAQHAAKRVGSCLCTPQVH
jgi:hypothetical protein